MQFLFHCSVDECQFSNAYCLKNLHTLHIIRIKMFLSKHPIKNVKVRPLNPRHEARFWHGVLFTMNISGTWINILMIMTKHSLGILTFFFSQFFICEKSIKSTVDLLIILMINCSNGIFEKNWNQRLMVFKYFLWTWVSVQEIYLRWLSGC